MNVFDPYAKRRAKAAAARAQEMRAVDFALPVDGDVPDVRRPTPRVGGLLDALVADLTRDRSPFYDEAYGSLHHKRQETADYEIETAIPQQSFRQFRCLE